MFAAPPNGLTVQIIDNKGSNCTLRLYDAKADELALVAWSPGKGPVTLDTNGSPKVYVFDDNCVIRLTAKA